MRHASRLAATVLAAIALVATAGGCGSAEDSTESTRAEAARRAALDRKLEQLERKLSHRQAALRAERAQERREAVAKPAGQDAERAASGGGFAQVEAQLDGEVGATIGAPGSSQALAVGDLGSGSAWSTSKVPIALRVLEEAGGPSGLSATQADEMRRALTLSDNEAAAALFADLERTHGGIAGASAAVGEVLREAGDSTTQISTQ